MTPLVSIAMPSYNQAQYIGAAIESVYEQAYANLELIISDGGSTDGTVEILNEYAQKYPTLRWTSEPDSGPADAIMKSFRQARGEIIGWLNSDDLYADGAIYSIVQAFSENLDWLMCYGRGEHIDPHGQSIGSYPTQTPEIGLRGFEGGCFICQPTLFFKSPVLALLGGLDQSLKTAFDYDYWIRAFKAFPERIGFADHLIAQSRLHEDCITSRMRATVALEGMALSQRHLGRAQIHWAATYLDELRTEHKDQPDAFVIEAKSFLKEAANYLSSSDLKQMQWAVQSATGTMV